VSMITAAACLIDTAHPLRLTDVRHLPLALRGGFTDCTALLPPFLREVAFAKQKTE